ncbi:MAG: 3-oxoacyl-ACP synthase [Bacteroidetes bacterium]|nr:3-oxoacyl-ACP synthase [Bacteroidota bacterium]
MTENPLHLKKRLHTLCQQQVALRISTAKEAMDAAQAAANNEGKSSAGDKYETGRAMMQLERDQHARLLAEGLKLRQVLDHLDPSLLHDQVRLGSLVKTSGGNFYVSISLGKLTLDGTDYIAISPITPLGKVLLGLKEGSSTFLSNQKIQVLEVV